MNWRAMKADLRIPQFQLGPAPGAGAATDALTLKNSEPIAVRFTNSVVTDVESAHLVGRGTDLSITGRVSPEQKAPLDLRVNGHLDLAFLQDFQRSSDLALLGGVVADGKLVRER